MFLPKSYSVLRIYVGFAAGIKVDKAVSLFFDISGVALQ